MLKLQFLIGKKYNEEWSTVKNCNFSKLQFFKCNFTVISLHIFAVLFTCNTKLIIFLIEALVYTRYFLAIKNNRYYFNFTLITF